jgi:cob(I)alamin adenosyltransferase
MPLHCYISVFLKRRPNLKKGYLQIYTGNGKGKTTAALGLCVRALANNMKVLFVQFIKTGSSGEFAVLDGFKNFSRKCFGSGCFIQSEPRREEIERARKGLVFAKEKMESGKFDVIVLDEVFPAVNAGLFSEQNLLGLCSSRHPGTELILTGRAASGQIIEIADLVSEIKEIKHYYSKGVQARKGIEQ